MLSAVSTPVVVSPAPVTRTPEQLEELELIGGRIADDPAAWRQFNAKYSRLIYRCITKVTGRFSSVTSADDVTEIYSMLALQLLNQDKRKLRSFDADRGCRFSSWIGMLSTHAAYDFLRIRRRSPIASDAKDAESVAASCDSPFDSALNRQRAALVADVVKSFSSKDQTFMSLYFSQGLEPEEVAVRMNISVKTVYSKKHKLTARLSEALAGEVVAA